MLLPPCRRRPPGLDPRDAPSRAAFGVSTLATDRNSYPISATFLPNQCNLTTVLIATLLLLPQALTRELLPRVPLLGPVRSDAEVEGGALCGPLGEVSLAALAVAGLPTLMAWDQVGLPCRTVVGCSKEVRTLLEGAPILCARHCASAGTPCRNTPITPHFTVTPAHRCHSPGRHGRRLGIVWYKDD